MRGILSLKKRGRFRRGPMIRFDVPVRATMFCHIGWHCRRIYKADGLMRLTRRFSGVAYGELLGIGNSDPFGKACIPVNASLLDLLDPNILLQCFFFYNSSGFLFTRRLV
jgi:hypothetical protein